MLLAAFLNIYAWSMLLTYREGSTTHSTLQVSSFDRQLLPGKNLLHFQKCISCQYHPLPNNCLTLLVLCYKLTGVDKADNMFYFLHI